MTSKVFGRILQRIIQIWLRITGRTIRKSSYSWLVGPTALGDTVGSEFYNAYAHKQGLVVSTPKEGGLLSDFGALQSATFDPSGVHPKIADFYEHTAGYKMEVWAQWFGVISVFAKILINAISTRMMQMNIPLSPLESSMGMTSNIIELKTANTNEHIYTCWLRTTVKTGKVVYAGFYATSRIGNGDPLVKVVFPLPKGNVCVMLRPELQDDGSFKLLSDGKGFGQVGYYRTQVKGLDALKVRYIPIKEMIHVFVDQEGVLRTDHIFKFWGMKFLHLHYKIVRSSS